MKMLTTAALLMAMLIPNQAHAIDNFPPAGKYEEFPNNDTMGLYLEADGTYNMRRMDCSPIKKTIKFDAGEDKILSFTANCSTPRGTEFISIEKWHTERDADGNTYLVTVSSTYGILMWKLMK